tara:strand:+ start:103 stop:468 length:366 start_codon:yes stop_codon:yes gene_type:complete
MDIENKNKELMIQLLKTINVNIDCLDKINNMEIDREILKNKEIISKYYSMIPELKKIYNSDMFSCLHKNSLDKQKQPAVCMLRQLLKANNYKMEPKIYNLGYNKVNGKKLVKRTYLIQKII